jgi:hypothetical protein
VLLAPRSSCGGGGDEGAVVVASKRFRHGGAGDGSDDDDRVLAVAARAPVASLMVVWRHQRVRETKSGSDSGRKVGTEFIL